MVIEQAIFTSAKTNQSAGYQLVASSPGLAHEDANEIAVWGPSHDSLLDGGAEASSINFHPLPSGAYCVSKTSAAGGEYSGRGGQRVYTQCLAVPPPLLRRFGNNPFAVLNAALAQGSVRVLDKVPGRLEPLRLVGRAASVDAPLLRRLAGSPDVRWIAPLIKRVISTPNLALAVDGQRDRLIAGLFSCLPVECRAEFSFSTGLKYSPRRPFRLVALSTDRDELFRVGRSFGIPTLELNGDFAEEEPTSGWAALVHQLLQGKRLTLLRQILDEKRPELSIDRIDELGQELLARHVPQVASVRGKTPGGRGSARPTPAAAAPAARTGWSQLPRLSARAGVETLDQPNLDGGPATAVPDAAARLAEEIGQEPAVVLGQRCPEAIEQLELLDDTVFEAIAGKPQALEQLKGLWPQMLGSLDRNMVDESREQYTRHALGVWKDCNAGDGTRSTARATAAIEVLCVLFDR